MYHIPKKEKWEFDESVTLIFEDMLSRSIPQYEVMRKAVTDICHHFLTPEGHLIDIGCSKGEQIKRCLRKNKTASYHGIEISESMISHCLSSFEESKNLYFYQSDLRKDWPSIPDSDVIVSVLTLQFIPVEYRLSLLSKIYKNLKPGGVFVLVEKVIGNSVDLDDLMTTSYYNLKHDNGYSIYEIERKRLSLEGVLVPLTLKMNEQMLQSAGFTETDTFWRWFNFTGLISIKR